MGYRRLFIMRKDLNMSPGKLAAQVGHCAEAFWTWKLREAMCQTVSSDNCTEDILTVHGKYSLGYDLLVKDTPFSPDWICYENLPDPVRYDVRNLEREMFQVLDRAVKKYDLSFTECRFPKLDGSSGKRK